MATPAPPAKSATSETEVITGLSETEASSAQKLDEPAGELERAAAAAAAAEKVKADELAAAAAATAATAAEEQEKAAAEELAAAEKVKAGEAAAAAGASQGEASPASPTRGVISPVNLSTLSPLPPLPPVTAGDSSVKETGSEAEKALKLMAAEVARMIEAGNQYQEAQMQERAEAEEDVKTLSARPMTSAKIDGAEKMLMFLLLELKEELEEGSQQEYEILIKNHFSKYSPGMNELTATGKVGDAPQKIAGWYNNCYFFNFVFQKFDRVSKLGIPFPKLETEKHRAIFDALADFGGYVYKSKQVKAFVKCWTGVTFEAIFAEKKQTMTPFNKNAIDKMIKANQLSSKVVAELKGIGHDNYLDDWYAIVYSHVQSVKPGNIMHLGNLFASIVPGGMKSTAKDFFTAVLLSPSKLVLKGSFTGVIGLLRVLLGDIGRAIGDSESEKFAATKSMVMRLIQQVKYTIKVLISEKKKVFDILTLVSEGDKRLYDMGAKIKDKKQYNSKYTWFTGLRSKSEGRVAECYEVMGDAEDVGSSDLIKGMAEIFNYKLTEEDKKHKEMRMGEFYSEHNIPAKDEMNYEQKMMVERIDRLLTTWINYAKALYDFDALINKLMKETLFIQSDLTTKIRKANQTPTETEKQQGMETATDSANNRMKVVLEKYKSALKGLGQAATDVGVKFNFTMAGKLEARAASVGRSLKRGFSERIENRRQKSIEAARIKKQKKLSDARRSADSSIASAAFAAEDRIAAHDRKARADAERQAEADRKARAESGALSNPLMPGGENEQPGGGRKRSYTKKRRRSKKRSYKRRSTKRRSKKRSYKKRSYKRGNYKKRRSTKRRYTRRN